MSIDIFKLAEAVGQKPEKAASYTPVAAAQYAKEEPVPDFELDDDGEEYQSVGIGGILAATEKQLAVNRGLENTDERDSMQFQKVFRPHALFRERVKMDSGKLARTAMYRAAKSKNLSGIGPGYFNGYIDSVLVGNPLTSPLEEINMMQLVTNARRITRMGPGGLPGSESITEEAQAVHPSQFGFIDPISGPECCVDNEEFTTRVFTSEGWVRIKDITEDSELMCNFGTGITFQRVDRVVHEHYEGKVYGVKNDNVQFLVTPGHRVYEIAEDGRYTVELARDAVGADVCIPSGPLAASCVRVTSEDWYTVEDFSGMVHCATVPGGMMYISVNGCPGFWTGNSERAGIDVRIAMGVKIGSNGRLYQKMYNRLKKRYEWVSPGDLAGRVVKLPD